MRQRIKSPYKVIFFNPTSPNELEQWLNTLYNQDNLKLLAVDNGYYIFEVEKTGIIKT